MVCRGCGAAVVSNVLRRALANREVRSWLVRDKDGSFPRLGAHSSEIDAWRSRPVGEDTWRGCREETHGLQMEDCGAQPWCLKYSIDDRGLPRKRRKRKTKVATTKLYNPLPLYSVSTVELPLTLSFDLLLHDPFSFTHQFLLRYWRCLLS